MERECGVGEAGRHVGDGAGIGVGGRDAAPKLLVVNGIKGGQAAEWICLRCSR